MEEEGELLHQLNRILELFLTSAGVPLKSILLKYSPTQTSEVPIGGIGVGVAVGTGVLVGIGVGVRVGVGVLVGVAEGVFVGIGVGVLVGVGVRVGVALGKPPVPPVGVGADVEVGFAVGQGANSQDGATLPTLDPSGQTKAS
jgi:hypothetical protein